MKGFIGSVILWSAVICALPAAAGMIRQQSGAALAASAQPAAEISLPCGELVILDEASGETAALGLEDYAVYAVLAEIPYVLEDEAVKAQVCAARTYGARRLLAGTEDNGAHITRDSGRYQVCLTDAQARTVYGDGYESALSVVRAAAEATRGEIIACGGAPIVAAFHLSSAGATEDAGTVWGISVPYLVSVPSDCTVKEYTLTYAEIAARISAAYPQAGGFDGVNVISRSPAGGAAEVSVCGITLSGAELAMLLNLDSAAFEVTDSGGKVVFTVKGSGHLAGMSMLGAEEMAKSGSGYRDILAHYYPETEITKVAY